MSIPKQNVEGHSEVAKLGPRGWVWCHQASTKLQRAKRSSCLHKHMPVGACRCLPAKLLRLAWHIHIPHWSSFRNTLHPERPWTNLRNFSLKSASINPTRKMHHVMLKQSLITMDASWLENVDGASIDEGKEGKAQRKKMSEHHRCVDCFLECSLLAQSYCWLECR